MIHNTFVDIAQGIAITAHRGQYRRGLNGLTGNVPYIQHCHRVADKFGDPVRRATGWLHDAMEDHPDKVSRESLAAAGIPEEVIVACELLNKNNPDGTKKPYDEYLVDIFGNEIARDVKTEDMLDNLSDNPTEKQIVRYCASLLYLKGRLTGAELKHALYHQPDWAKP